MFAPVTHIYPLTKIRRARMLPDKGTVLVLVGQQVNATDVIAESPPRSKHILIDVPNALGIPYNKFSRELITRNVGEKLFKGDVLAENRKRFNRILRAPADGEIMMISRGRVLYELLQPAVPILANYPGLIVEVIPDYGVILETTGALIQGIWGNGKVSTAPLHIIHNDADGMLTLAQIDDSLRGVIGLAGQCRDQATMRAAAELPMKGLILGSISSELVEMARQLPLPVILLEGFTGTGINQAAAKILYENEKREVCLNAIEMNRYRGDRPEVIIPLQETGEVMPENYEFRQGRMVRVLDDPHKSAIGIIEAVHHEPVMLANGLWTKTATIRLENNKKISSPIVNLEILD